MKKSHLALFLSSSLAAFATSVTPSSSAFVLSREYEEIRNAASGDVVFSSQEFHRWNLYCNELLSKSLKECSLANKGVFDTFASETILAPGVDGKLYLNIAIITPDIIFRDNGFFLDINGKQKFLTEESVACVNLDRMCTIQVPFTDEVRDSFVNEKPISGRFFIKTDSGEPLQRRFTLDMDNTSLAIKYFDQMFK